jgi:5,5'-dehydrodivanillate O-demethylase
MLSVKENERLTRVGPGTPMGELMRRYWHPIAAVPELDQNPTKEVRLLAEDLVLYKDRSGTLGLIQKECPHRRVHMLYGIPEQKGLRCPYHGWLFNQTGRCLEMPAEAPDSTFPQRVTVKAYPVQELGGLIFAYLGPQPAPLLPRWEWLLEEHAYRQVNILVLPCNWLQCMENSLDPTHLEWIHAYYSNYVYERKGMPPEMRRRVPRHLKIGFDVFEHGIIKRRVFEGETEQDADWTVGHPILFPNMLSNPNQFRVPMDDTHTLHLDYEVHSLPSDVPSPSPREITVYHPPLTDEQGRYVIDYVFGQDYMGWATQGPIAERHLEKLGEADKGIILYRRLLKQQLGIVEDGGVPMNVFRDPAQNVRIQLPNESKGAARGLKSVRKSGVVQRFRYEEPLPPWVNPQPWAGHGLRHYLARLGRAKVPAEVDPWS